MNAADLRAALADAWLEFSGIEHSGGYLVVPGAVEQPQQPHRLFGQVQRHPFSLTFRYVSRFEVADASGLGGILVQDVEYRDTESCFCIRGRDSGQLLIWTPSSNVFLEVDSQPAQVRRRLRWRPVHSRHA